MADATKPGHIALELPKEIWDYVINVLAEKPYHESAAIIHELQGQFKALEAKAMNAVVRVENAVKNELESPMKKIAEIVNT